MGKFIQYQKDSSLEDYERKLEEIVKEERAKGNKIVVTSGVYDILIPEHITQLRKIKEEYKKENGILFVNVTNDSRVKLHKGPNKPINTAYNRAFIVANLKGVDYVSVHPEEKSRPVFQLAKIVKPDYFVQAMPWTKELKKELSSVFLEAPLPELVEFERISELDFSKISMGQFIQFEKYEKMAYYREKLEEIVKKEKEKGKKVVLTSGTFDVLIPRHVRYLNGIKGKYPESVLFVNIANDERVRIRKGEHKPRNTSYKRAFVISNLGAVDYATVHPEEKSRPVFQIAGIIKPDYLVQPFFLDKKSKKELKGILGKEHYNKMKRICFSKRQPGLHTTDLFKRAMDFYSDEGESDFNKFTSMHFAELSEKLKKSRSFEEFYEQNPEAKLFIQAFKELAKKPEKYIELRSSLISNVLKLKTAWDFSSYDELNEFITKLTELKIQKPSLEKNIEETEVQASVQKSEELPSDADLVGGEY